MKKFALFLTGMLIAAVSIVNVYAESYQITGKKDKLLYDLGVISEVTENRSIEMTDNITRGEFVACVMKMAGKDTELYRSKNIFTDVTQDTPYAGAINCAYESGIVSGMYEGFFVPDAPIYTGHAIRIIMGVLGYDAIAAQYGGYPDGYLKTAAMAEVISNVKFSIDEPLTFATAVQMLYNAIDADIVYLDPSFGGQYQTGSGETLLNSVLKVKKARGTVTANEVTSLESGEGVGKGNIEIDGTVYADKTGDAGEYLGYEVDYYCYDNQNDLEIISVIPRKDDNKVTIDAADIHQYSDHTYTYYEENAKKKQLRLSASCYVIYNGKVVVSGYDRVKYMPLVGNVTAVDGNGDGDYDILKIMSYDTINVSSVLSEDTTIIDKSDITRNMVIDDEMEYTVKDENGNEIAFGQIQADDVLLVAKSLDDKLAEIYVSHNTAEGKVTYVNRSDGEKTVEIEGERYKISPNCYDIVNVAAGDEGTFYFDVFGNISYFSQTKRGQYRYGYVRKMLYDTDEDAVTVKLVNDEGLTESLKLAEKIQLNDAQKLEPSSVYEMMQGEAQLIMYLTNTKEEISKIQTTNGSTLRTLYESGSGSGLKFWSASGTFDAKVPVSKSAVVFVIPTDMQAYDYDMYYTAKKRAYLSNNNRYVFEAYNCDAESDFGDAVVVYKSYSAPIVDQGIALVDTVDMAVNEEGETVYQLHLFFMGTEIDLYTVSENTVSEVSNEDGSGIAPSVESGDVIRFSQSPEGAIEKISMVYDYSEMAFTGSGTSTSMDAQYRPVFGSVYSIEDNVIKLYLNEKDISQGGSHNAEFYTASQFKIYVYDTSEGKARAYMGTENDLRDYKHYGDSYSRIVLQTKNGEAGALVIYKR